MPPFRLACFPLASPSPARPPALARRRRRTMLALFPVLAPSLPLLAFLSASASTVQASSSPPDPFANPKFALTFLNDLPIERSLADRYLAEGIASPAAFYHLGDTSTGRAVSAGDELAPNARRGIEGHPRRSGDDDNDHDASAVIPMAEDAAAAVSVGEPSGTSPPSSNQPTHNYTLEHLLLPPSRSYLCLLPPPPPKNTFGQHPASSPPVPPMDPELPAKLLQHLDDQCLYVRWEINCVCCRSRQLTWAVRPVQMKQGCERARPPFAHSIQAADRLELALRVHLRVLPREGDPPVPRGQPALAASPWGIRPAGGPDSERLKFR